MNPTKSLILDLTKVLTSQANFGDKLPFVNPTKSLILDLTKVLFIIAQRFTSYISFDCEGYALSDTFTELKSSY